MSNDIVCGDALDELKKLENDSVDLICTDPPYGYSFMGKDWDKAVPSVGIWQECLRVLKPGAFCFVMSAPRSDVQNAMISRLMEAGFRLDFTPIYWTYASGFPKAGNIGKMVDKRLGNEREILPPKQFADGTSQRKTARAGIYSEEKGQAQNTRGNSHLEGSYAGFQPKPAVEVIIVAMKPLSEKTYVDQALANGKGITWLDDCRVPYEPTDYEKVKAKNVNNGVSEYKWDEGTNSKSKEVMRIDNPAGRFPANLLISDDVLNDGVERKSGSGNKNPSNSNIYGGNSMLASKTVGNDTNYTGDSGSYSRYFDLDKWASTLPFLIVPKASKGEKNKGLENREPALRAGVDKMMGDPQMKTGSGNERSRLHLNNHPTVKPLKLMSYLITLGSREGDTVLDPFVGSGTTCLAAKKLKRNYIGIEREPEYVEIANARLDVDKQGVLL